MLDIGGGGGGEGREGGGPSAAGTGSHLVYRLVYCSGCNGREREREGGRERVSERERERERRGFSKIIQVKVNTFMNGSILLLLSLSNQMPSPGEKSTSTAHVMGYATACPNIILHSDTLL